MRLGRCSNCRERLRFGQTVCTRCGARKSRVRQIFAVVITLQVVAIGWFVNTQHVSHAATLVEDPAAVSADAPPLRPAATPASGWLYFQTHDRMLDDVTKHARLLGRDTAGTASDVLLELQSSPVYSSSVTITLDRTRGAPVPESCLVNVSFDGAAATPLQASVVSDRLHVMLVIDHAQALIEKLRHTQTWSIDARTSRTETRSATFQTRGLNF